MKKIAVVFGCFLLTFALLGCSGRDGGRARRGEAADVITIKASTFQVATQQMGLGIKLLGENLTKELGDRVNFLGYDSAQLYPAQADLEALARGEIQFVFASSANVESYSQSMQLLKTPWLFSDVDAAYNFVENSETMDRINTLEASGLLLKGIFASGNSIFTNNEKPLKVPADFRGMKIRTPGSIDTLSLTSLGANALVTPAAENYSMVQNGVLDGLMLPSSAYIPTRIYEVQKYMTRPGFMVFQHGYMITNKAWYDGLPEDFRAGLDRAIDATITKMRSDDALSEVSIYEQAAQHGVEVHLLTDEERALWQQTTQGVYDEIRKMLGAELVDSALKEAASM